jgi:hypothetical protein
MDDYAISEPRRIGIHKKKMDAYPAEKVIR